MSAKATLEWLEEVGLIGEHDLGNGVTLYVYGYSSPDISFETGGYYRSGASVDLERVVTQDDYRKLAYLFNIQLKGDNHES